jgi:hypothetical protein
MAWKWSKLWAILRAALPKKGAARRAARFVKRFVMLSELTEEQQISNLDKYLKTSQRTIESLRAAGASDAVVQKVVAELMIPAAMAQRDALIVTRLAAGSEVSAQSKTVEVSIHNLPPKAISSSDERDAMASGESVQR